MERLAAAAPVSPVEIRAPGRWQVATVDEIRTETPTVKSFRFNVPMWIEHLPGQHYDVRLTAPDGYQAERSYSIASSPCERGEIELTVDRLADGEVSPYFHDVVEVGDQVELRGPFAAYFVWRCESPVLLIGGGSGVVPLMCMLRHKRLAMPQADMKLAYSVRTAADLIYADEIGDDATVTYTRKPPEGWEGHTGRIDAAMIAPLVTGDSTVFVCGSNGFVEAASTLALEAGVDAARIRTERFGPTGF